MKMSTLEWLFLQKNMYFYDYPIHPIKCTQVIKTGRLLDTLQHSIINCTMSYKHYINIYFQIYSTIPEYCYDVENIYFGFICSSLITSLITSKMLLTKDQKKKKIYYTLPYFWYWGPLLTDIWKRVLLLSWVVKRMNTLPILFLRK